MHYLVVDPHMPKPHGTSNWSPRIDNATPFSCSNDANAQKEAVADDTEVIRVDDKWYVVKR